MAAILGLDAAWTEGRASGVALVTNSRGAWKCIALAPSCKDFVDLARESQQIDWAKRTRGSAVDPLVLLMAARQLLGGQMVDVVAVDMPMATTRITRRRAADDAVSQSFGRKGCGTHTPNEDRPGPIGERLTRGFRRHGYSLAVHGAKRSKVLLEVYPHPALLVLLKADFRVPYKANKTTTYWPGLSSEARMRRVHSVYRKILGGLRSHIEFTGCILPRPTQFKNFSSLKRYEDALDALVCAWVGIKFLQGKTRPYGDDTATIWIPD